LHAALEARQFLNDIGLQGFHRKQGNQPDHGPDLQWTACMIRQMQHIVEKAIPVIPQGMPADIIHGMRNVHEVLEKFAGDILISVIVSRQLEGDGQHVQAVHAHPARAI
jgi:hypothetical protein